MSTNFPTAPDDGVTLPNPTTSNNLGNPDHAGLHDNVNDAIKAIELKLGTGISTPGADGYLLCVVAGKTIWQSYAVGGDLIGNLPNPSLASTGVAPGTYGSSLQIPVITVDGKGRITSVSNIGAAGGGGGGASVLTTKGDLISYDTAPNRLAIGTNGQILTADSTQPLGLKWGPAPNSAIWGGITGTLSNQTDLQSALNAKAASGANSDITSLTGLTTALSVAQGGSGRTTLTTHGVLLGNGATAINSTVAGTAGQLLVSGGSAADPTWLTILPIASGGTGSATQNFVDLSTAQTVAGAKTFSATIIGSITGNAATVTTNANLTGPITSSGNATAIVSQTGTGTKFVMDTSPVINTGTVGADPSVNLGIASKQYVDAFGTTSLITNEIPAGVVNGSNTAFTTASTFTAGSLRVYLNGQRLKASGNDFTEAAQGFTMAYAPATGDVLLVDYNVGNTKFIQGSNSIIVQETPTGTVNGTTTVFTVLQSKYVANTLEVFINGLAQIKTTDYAETSPGSGTFTFVTAPLTGDLVRVNYQFSTGASGNADTVDGFHASATPIANNLLPLNASGQVPNTVLGVAWAAYTPVVTPSTGTFTTVSAAGKFSQSGKTVTGYVEITQTNVGTAGGGLTFSLPVLAQTTPILAMVGGGREDSITGKMLQIKGFTSNSVAVFYYDNTVPIGSGLLLRIGFTYEAA